MQRVGARVSPVCRPHRLTSAGCTGEVTTPLLRHCSPFSTLGSPAHEDEEFTRSLRHRRTTICSPLLSHMRIASEDDHEDRGEEERNEARVSSPIASRRFVRPRNDASRPPWINGSDHATAVCRAATTASEPEAHSGREHGLGRPGQMRPTLVGCETFGPLKNFQPESL
jgi:hypothetical protein